MAHDEHHEHLVKEIAEQFEPVFTKSPHGIYIYLDDKHKTCNKKFAEMLGYKSVADWVANEYPVGDVSEADQEKVINAYGEASRNLKASKVFASIVRKDGKKIKVNIIMAPITYKGEVFVIHFISEEK
ncbi:MAG: hypothetical protein A3D74_02690 [Candidatus Levybacteria bacterium RIFCSPHIGHO2_02_FULL_37_13]|nr:MAG: hypothetical protein A3D74_02690 [Candidatus Levybacteria bacterium RIFCSPHIGHO2_02_FULL_37_13]